jgi:hypothetical protein
MLFPWTDPSARKRAARFVLSATAVFAAIAAPFMWRGLGQGFNDEAFYFDTKIDPSYFAIWLWDLPGPIMNWPPRGQDGGRSAHRIIGLYRPTVSFELRRPASAYNTDAARASRSWLERFGFSRPSEKQRARARARTLCLERRCARLSASRVHSLRAGGSRQT